MHSAHIARSDDYIIRPTSGPLGAEVIGLDVSNPLDADTLHTIQQAFFDYHL